MSEDTQLATRQEPSIAMMLQGVIQGGITADNADALEKMLAVYERMEARRAEQEFSAAFVRLQSEMPVIVAQSVIPNRGKYERFEDVMHVVKPLLIKNGFSVSFEQNADDKRITVTCHLRHVGGHATKTPFGVRLGGKADSDTQADCKASTTAKRNALLQALNIVIRQDCMQDEDDARFEASGVITIEQAVTLRDWVEALGGDVPKFLAFAGAESFQTIPASKYDSLCESLRKKERDAKK